MALRTVRATRYVTPLREGGSMPAVVEGDEDGMYVLKFRGAGQGLKALVAELVAGELARAAGLPVPEIVRMELDPDMARTEPDPEIQHLIRASAGLNLALDYLPGSVAFDPVAEQPESSLASRVVWFDAFVTNVDRTARNTNLLIWHRNLWLIDHGAALYFHHAVARPEDWPARSADRFPMVKDHVLLPFADHLPEADARMADWLSAPGLMEEVLTLVPDEWLSWEGEGDAAARRAAYVAYLRRRLESPRGFAEEAVRARRNL